MCYSLTPITNVFDLLVIEEIQNEVEAQMRINLAIDIVHEAL